MERENGAASHVIRVINESALLIWGLPCLFWKKVWWSAVKRILFATHQHKQHRRQFHPLWPTTMLICLLILHFIQIGLIALSLLFDRERRTATHSTTIYTILVVYIICPHNWWILSLCMLVWNLLILMYKHISCTCTMWSHFIRCLFSLSTTWHLPQKRKWLNWVLICPLSVKCSVVPPGLSVQDVLRCLGRGPSWCRSCSPRKGFLHHPDHWSAHGCLSGALQKLMDKTDQLTSIKSLKKNYGPQ